MKKLLLLLTTIAFISCGESNECSYSKLQMTNQIGDGEIKKGIFEGCFQASEPDQLGFLEVSDNEKRIKVIFDNTSDFLNIKGEDNKIVEYRKKLGHQIMIMNKPDSLLIIYGDIHGSKSKSTLLFTK